MEYYSAFKMERDSAISGNMHEPAGHDAERNKPDGERQNLYDLTSIWDPKKSKTQRQRVEQWLPGVGGVEVGRDWPRGYGVAVV